METVEHILHWAVEVIDLIGVAILLFGFTKVFIRYIYVEIKSSKYTHLRKLQTLRSQLGIYILLALDFLIAADIVLTVTRLTQQQLISLAVLIGIRTAIGYFLSKEIAEIGTESES